MQYVNSSELSSGMYLARSLHYYDTTYNKVLELKKSTILSQLIIQKIIKEKIKGVYIDFDLSNITIAPSISPHVKEEALSAVAQLSESFNGKGLKQDDIDILSKTAEDLVESFNPEDEIFVNLYDIKSYDDYTYHHSVNVAIISLAMAMELEFTKDKLKEIVMCGLLHDIGKVAIPIEIINKPSKLTPEEFEIVKHHPANAGIYLADKHLVSNNIYMGIISHHEKWDGSGYPCHLKQIHIPLYGRILTVADVYDALTSKRPYRQPAKPNEAIEYIMGGTDTYFDEQIVKIFMRVICPYPVGIEVKLSNNFQGIVIKNNKNNPLRPVVKLTNSSKIIDLYNDVDSMNIVILDTIEHISNSK